MLMCVSGSLRSQQSQPPPQRSHIAGRMADPSLVPMPWASESNLGANPNGNNKVLTEKRELAYMETAYGASWSHQTLLSWPRRHRFASICRKNDLSKGADVLHDAPCNLGFFLCVQPHKGPNQVVQAPWLPKHPSLSKSRRHYRRFATTSPSSPHVHHFRSLQSTSILLYPSISYYDLPYHRRTGSRADRLRPADSRAPPEGGGVGWDEPVDGGKIQCGQT